MRTGSGYFLLLAIVITCFNAPVYQAKSSMKDELLPPLEKWRGESERLIVSSDNPWQTPAEKSGLIDTPSYSETMFYLDRLIDSDPRLQKISLGKSPQGRDIWMVVASSTGHQQAEQLLKEGKPTLLVQAGIHSGEIDGKDAGLMLLRDIIHGGKDKLLNKVNLLFVPILSVDTHERRSSYNRVNQRGPKQMGWRTNARNLNLNRDYSKLDTKELQHLIRAINIWQPDLYFDVHVTDGEDYQYDITYGYNLSHTDSPNISNWLDNYFRPEIDEALNSKGHLGGPLIFGVDPTEFSKGLHGWTASPRFSNGYGDIRHLPTILVENHSLKPYRQRVLGTYVFLEQSLKLLAREAESLRQATSLDKKSRPEHLVLSWTLDKENPEKKDFAGIEYTKAIDEITGTEYVQWTGKAKTYKNMSIFWERIPKVEVRVAKNYWIPSQYQQLQERLAIHGIQFEKSPAPVQIKAHQLIATEFNLKDTPFEGHQQASAKFKTQEKTVSLPKGSIRVSTDQPLGRLVVALLDPRGPDSFFSWGFFNQMFQRTEYIENYAMIPLIKAMIKSDKNLESQFQVRKKQDKEFAEDPKAQLRWFYERSEFYDKKYLMYPVILEY
ncbi:MAG: M14 family metallopeptidase [Gammaproteobacteria bacterium]|nr:M14 family metallopeptidase [Gammaproteobacteria bacterium]